jgi:hypothetical protein
MGCQILESRLHIEIYEQDDLISISEYQKVKQEL